MWWARRTAAGVACWQNLRSVSLLIQAASYPKSVKADANFCIGSVGVNCFCALRKPLVPVALPRIVRVVYHRICACAKEWPTEYAYSNRKCDGCRWHESVLTMDTKKGANCGYGGDKLSPKYRLLVANKNIEAILVYWIRENTKSWSIWSLRILESLKSKTWKSNSTFNILRVRGNRRNYQKRSI